MKDEDDRHITTILIDGSSARAYDAVLRMSKAAQQMGIELDVLMGRIESRSKDILGLMSPPWPELKVSGTFGYGYGSTWPFDIQKPRGKYYKDYAMDPFTGYQKHPAQAKQKLKPVGKKPTFVLMDRNKRTRNRVWKPTL
jgi:hypothetical protein